MTETLKFAAWICLAASIMSFTGGCNPPIAASSKEPVAATAAGKEAPATTDGAVEAESVSDVTSPKAVNPAVADSTAAAATEPGSAPKVNRPPRADRVPARAGEAEKITFDDLNLQMPANIVFRPFMLNDRVKELEGQRVSISGYMHGGAAGASGIKKFVLLKNTECKFGQDGQADHLAMVYLKNGSTADYTRSDIKVEGTLKIEPFTGDDGNTWSIYNLEEAQIR